MRALLLIEKSASSDVSYKTFSDLMKLPYVAGDPSDGTTDIVSCLTPCAAKLVLAELEAAKKKPDISSAVCTCILSKTMMLPCRHTFATRMASGVHPLFQQTDAAARWHIAYSRSNISTLASGQSDCDEATPHIAKRFEHVSAPKSYDDKYSWVMSVGKQLAGYCALLGSEECKEKLAILDQLYHHWSNGRNIAIVEMVDSTSSTFPPADVAVTNTEDVEVCDNDG